jgi:hypothetical protein
MVEGGPAFAGHFSVPVESMTLKINNPDKKLTGRRFATTPLQFELETCSVMLAEMKKSPVYDQGWDTALSCCPAVWTMIQCFYPHLLYQANVKLRTTYLDAKCC